MYTIIPQPNFEQPTKQKCLSELKVRIGFILPKPGLRRSARARRVRDRKRRQGATVIITLELGEKSCAAWGNSLLTKYHHRSIYPPSFAPGPTNLSLHQYVLDSSNSWCPFTRTFSIFVKSAIFDGTLGCRYRSEAVPLYPWIPINEPVEFREPASPLFESADLILQGKKSSLAYQRQRVLLLKHPKRLSMSPTTLVSCKKIITCYRVSS